MQAVEDASPTTTITGNTMQIGERHSVAIYQRDGRCWVAEFREGHGELVDAASWYRSNLGALRYSHGRRMAALATVQPITPEVIDQVEALHREAGRRATAVVPIFEALFATARRHCAKLAARFRVPSGDPMQTRGRPAEPLSR